MGFKAIKPDQHRSRKSTAACLFDGLSEWHLGADLAVYDSAQMRVANTNRPSYSGLVEPSGFEAFLESHHKDKFAASLQKVKMTSTSTFGLLVQNASMSEWPYRENFDRRYLEYRERTKASVKDVADALGKSPGTVNSYRRPQGSITPPPEVLVKAANLFECDIYEFMPNYGELAKIRADLSNMTEVDIYRTSEAVRILNTKGSTQQQRDMLMSALRERRDMIVTIEQALKQD